jgi:hypothetical protein
MIMQKIWSVSGRLMLMGVLLALPVAVHAQEASIQGTLTDATGGVLPGVTVTAQHDATGNIFLGVSDGTGSFNIPVRVGPYTLTAELPGFSTVVQSGLTLLVGQTAVVALEMAVSTLQETVTVTGEAPLLDTTSSEIGGNIDPMQMEELPINGRNFLSLTLMAPGAKANSVRAGGPPTNTTTGTFQVNVDGQQVTGNCCGTAHQASFSKEAIAEFQLISNRFDAVQGRSSGVQVNVVTKSGTNAFDGGVAGYFRHDSMNADDFIKKQKLPYQNQQFALSVGGPLRQDRIHFFGAVEYEREPFTITHNSQWPEFNQNLTSTRIQKKIATRLDFQFTPATRLSVTGSRWRDDAPMDPTRMGGASRHPSQSVHTKQFSDQIQGNLTSVIGNSTLNQFRVGGAGTSWDIEPNLTGDAGLGTSRNSLSKYPPNLDLRGYQIGPQQNYPQNIGQGIYNFRNDLTFSFEAGGRHDVRTGGEYLKYNMWHHWANYFNGNMKADKKKLGADLPNYFPVWDDASTWDLSVLNPVTRRFEASLGSPDIMSPRNIFGFWFQDDWQATDRLTINMGVRYDTEDDQFANDLEVLPFLKAGRPGDHNNVAPRFGFAYAVDDRTVIRGGAGKYFSMIINQSAHPVRFAFQQRVAEATFDGRSDFTTNPWNGALPAPDVLEGRFCNNNYVEGCFRRGIGQSFVSPHVQIPYSYQISLGVQRQVGDSMAVTVDYVSTLLRRDRVTNGNINLTYNEATGTNYPFKDISRRPFQDWGQVRQTQTKADDNYNGLESSFTKRFSDNWQASGTYTFGIRKRRLPQPVSGFDVVPFDLVGELGPQYGPAWGDQRHRAVFNGIWQIGGGLQLSGLYFYGSGETFNTLYGGDNRGLGSAPNGKKGRMRKDGTVVGYNVLTGRPIHRLDLRLQEQIPIGGETSLSLFLEVFNALNHENYGKYTGNESNANYGKPTYSGELAYAARMMQLGFRFQF